MNNGDYYTYLIVTSNWMINNEMTGDKRNKTGKSVLHNIVYKILKGVLCSFLSLFGTNV
jgi:hypothetical protein